MLAAGTRREGVVITRRELIDVAHGVDVRQLPFEHKSADDEVVMAMDVVSAARTAESLVAEGAQATEVGATRTDRGRN